MSRKTVLSIGQCAADNSSITWALRGEFDAQVVPARNAADALGVLKKGSIDLVLVNRLLDSDGSPGLAVIERIRAEPQLAKIPVMLVSNFADAQEQAVKAGAVPGFGKDRLGQPEMLESVRPYLDPAGMSTTIDR